MTFNYALLSIGSAFWYTLGVFNLLFAVYHTHPLTHLPSTHVPTHPLTHTSLSGYGQLAVVCDKAISPDCALLKKPLNISVISLYGEFMMKYTLKFARKNFPIIDIHWNCYFSRIFLRVYSCLFHGTSYKKPSDQQGPYLPFPDWYKVAWYSPGLKVIVSRDFEGQRFNKIKHSLQVTSIYSYIAFF